jgi:hypothetical protein
VADVVARLKTWVDRLALEREDAEVALVDAAERLLADEALEPLDAERELAPRERTPGAETAPTEPVELSEPASPANDEVHRLQDHGFAARAC